MICLTIVRPYKRWYDNLIELIYEIAHIAITILVIVLDAKGSWAIAY
jgi:hypothetical protein